MKRCSPAKVVRVVAFVIALCLTAQAAAAQAPAPSAVIEKLLAKVAEGEHTDRDREIAKLQALTSCSVNQMLESLAFRDPKGFQSRMDDTLRSIDAAIGTINEEMKNMNHGKRVNLTPWKYSTDLDLTGVVTQRNLLERILALIKSQREALNDMKSSANEAELSKALAHAIWLGGQISRMLTVYLTT